MYKLIIFAGTTEGRMLAEYCAENGIYAIVSVVSDYGKDLLPESPYVKIISGQLTAKQMEQLFLLQQTSMVVDATHPYAAQVSKNIQTACKNTGCPLIRLLRKSGEKVERENLLYFSTLEEGAAWLKEREGNILLTTGSKEISAFTSIENDLSRLYVRVLPSKAVVEQCESLGIKGKHLICMQGPFSEEMNIATIRQFQISFLVTKEAGRAGGYEEKISASVACGIKAVVIGRPSAEEGMDFGEVIKALKPLKAQGSAMISLVGIGMGGKDQITIKAAKALKECDLVLGAGRMVDSVSWIIGDIRREYVYLPNDILACLRDDKGWKRAAVIFSGDTGFYSGARRLIDQLSKYGYVYEVIPGISSISYLSAVFGVSWEDVCLRSLHGRDLNVVQELKEHRKLFLLLGGNHTVEDLCKTLYEAGYGDLTLRVGERLSYPEERLVMGTVRELLKKSFNSLAVVYIEQEIMEEV